MTSPVGTMCRSRNGCAGEGVRGWLRLAGGDNAIGMIWGDLVGSEQSEVRERASTSWWPVVQVWPGPLRAARSVGDAITA